MDRKLTDDPDRRYAELLDHAAADPAVVGVVAFGSRSRRVGGLVADPSAERLRDAFRMLEAASRAAGHGAVVDGWEPDVAWLRGEAPHRVPLPRRD